MTSRRFNVQLVCPIGVQREQGMALIMLVFILGLAVTAYLVYALNPTSVRIEREKKTAAALTEAKAALVGLAASNITPGQLPCPEDVTLIGMPTEGKAMLNCSNPSQRIGRLPWRTLGLGDIRDGNGDKLWYALSAGFRTSPINSDTPSQLTIDGVAGSAVAVIFSPGPVLSGQSRPVPSAISPPDLTQYLDLTNNDGDNTYVTTGAGGSFNDRLLLVSHNDLFGVVEKRVAGEALNCLNMYAAGNGGKYPWSAKLDLAYQDTSGQLFGRLPDTPFTVTHTDNPSMGLNWPASCTILSNSGWWLDWKELVFFAVADEYKPTGAAAICGTCLTVTPSLPGADKKIVVIVAGTALAGQNRSSNSDKGTLSNYLEAPNNGGGLLFAQQQATSTFNDVVVYR